jgi:hypothetical protein
MNNQLFSPFDIQLIDIDEEFFKIRVNFGNINSFIFNTYQSKFSNNTQRVIPDVNDLNDYNATTTSLVRTYPFPYYEETFSIEESCTIYLSIPKVPAGYDNYFYGSSNKDWWYGMKPEFFINQFRLIASTDEGFEEQSIKDFKYIEKNNQRLITNSNNGSLYLNDSDYPGKIYIKLADININQESKEISINKIFNSNVISPTRYFRLGSLNKRNIQIIYSTVYQSYGEIVERKYDYPQTEEEFRDSYTFFTQPISDIGYKSNYFNNPSYFNKKIEDIKSTLVFDISNKINYLNNNYFSYVYETAKIKWSNIISPYGRTISFSERNFREEKQFRKLYNLGLLQVIIITRDSLGEKIKIENFYENIAAFTRVKESVNKVNKWIEDSPNNYDYEPIPDIKPMTKKEAYKLLGLSEKIDDRSFNLESMVELIGFS